MRSERNKDYLDLSYLIRYDILNFQNSVLLNKTTAYSAAVFH